MSSQYLFINSDSCKKAVMVKIKRLSTEQKNDVIKQPNEGLSNMDIAKMLNIPVSTVESIILEWKKFGTFFLELALHGNFLHKQLEKC